MKNILMFALLVVALAGCGTQRIKEQQAKYEAENNQLIGQSFDDLVRKLGVPSGEAKLSDGSKIVEYSSSQTRVSGGGSYPIPVSIYVPNQNGVGGRWIYSERERSLPVSSKTYFCKLDFTLSAGGVVLSWKAEGNHCY
jgi:hypothetical protein